jgi:hypothetical protein
MTLSSTQLHVAATAARWQFNRISINKLQLTIRAEQIALKKFHYTT